MTKLKDLPEGTLLIGDSDRKGLYSNDNAPIFVMELGGTKAKVLWQGTSRYDAFMNPLIKKEHGNGLKENVDYILPENVGMMLPTQKPSKEDTENIFTFGSYMPSYSKFHVNLATLLDDVSDNYTYLKVLSEDKDKIGWKNWEDSAFIGDKVVMVSGLETMGGYYQVTFTKDEYEDIATRANSSIKRNGLPILPKFDPDNPVFEFVDEGNKEEPKFRVVISPDVVQDASDSYLNLEKRTPDNKNVTADWDVLKVSDHASLYMDSPDEEHFSDDDFITAFTLPEYKKIRKQALKNPEYSNMHWTLPEYDPDDARFELVSGDSLPVDPSTKGTKTLPSSVMLDLKTLELCLADLPEYLDVLKQAVDRLVDSLGKFDYDYWLFVTIQVLQEALNDSSEEDYEDIRDRVHQVIAMAHEEL